jgi:holo-[acyl-carrier protein] synthase
MLARMLSADEIRLSHGDAGPDIPGIAGRLAAKEAVFKLFHAPGEPLPWRGIEILTAEGGWPVVRLDGRAAALARRAGIDHIAVSITHDDPCAVAVAFCACPATPDPSRGPSSGFRVPNSGKRSERAAARPTVRSEMSAKGINEVRNWILKRHPERHTIDAEENLIDTRLVDSLNFVELVYVIENATGVEIDFDNIDVQDFQTLSAIEKAFFVTA